MSAGRFVRVVLTGASGERVVDEHLRAGLHAPLRGRRLADVLVGCDGDEGDGSDAFDGPGYGPDGGCAVCTRRGSASRHPGALVVAVPRGAECVLRYGGCAAAGDRLTLDGAHRARAPWEVWASLAHAWLVAGRSMVEFGTTPEAVMRRP